MKAKRGRRGEDGRTELSKPVLGSSEEALVSKASNAIDEIKPTQRKSAGVQSAGR